MNDPERPILEALDPPPGGLQDLRRRLGREPRRTAAVRLAWSSAAAAVVLGALLVVLQLASPAPLPEDDPRFAHALAVLGLAEPPTEPVTIPGSSSRLLAARRIPVPGDEVVFYRISTLAPNGDNSPD